MTETVHPRRPLCALILLLLALTSLAQGASADVHDDPVLDARITATYGLDAARLQVDPVDEPSCRPGTVERHPQEPGFTFQDSQSETQCAQVRYALDLPAGTDRIEIRFTQDRIVGPDLLGQTAPDRALVQRFRLLDDHGTAHIDDQVFDPGGGSRAAGPVRHLLDAPGGTDHVVLEWSFIDEGGSFASPAGHSLVSTVKVEGVSFVDIPLGSELGATETDLGGAIETFATRIEVPAALWNDKPIMAGSLTLRVQGETESVAVVAPSDATLAGEELSVVLVSGVSQIGVPSDALMAHGAGTWQVKVERPPSAITHGAVTQVIAESLHLLAVLGLVTPAGLGVSTLRAVRSFRAKCFGPFLATGRSLLATTVLVGAAYLAILLWVVLSGGFSAMTRWPVPEAGVQSYALLLVVDVAFVTVWVFADRFLVRAMEDDIARHAATETELRARADELQAFVYGVSHDLKTPVLALDWLTSDLEEDLKGAAGAEAQDTVRRIRSNVDGMRRLLDDLIAVSRVTSQEEVKTDVPLDQVLGEVLSSLERSLAKRGTQVTVDPAVEAVLDVEPARLHQVLVNLVENASKYGQDDAAQVDVRIHPAADDDGLLIDIDDDGPGVPEAERERIFHLFHRGDGAVSRKIGGTGIGLALVRKIVDGWGGTIDVDTAPLGGARFRVHLPPTRVISAEPTGAKDPDPATSWPAKGSPPPRAPDAVGDGRRSAA